MGWYTDPSPETQEFPWWGYWALVVVLPFGGIGHLFAGGIGNVLSVAAMPVATVWLAIRLFFFVGLFYQCRFVFVLFVAIVALHLVSSISVSGVSVWFDAASLFLSLFQSRRFCRAATRKHTNTFCCLCTAITLLMLGYVSRHSSVTFGAGLPWGATVVATKSDPPFAQDGRNYLIFDTDVNGIESFAVAYAGRPLESLLPSRTQLRGASPRGTFADVIEGLPWDLRKIQNGRFHRNAGTNGFLSIDVDRCRVYVFR